MSLFHVDFNFSCSLQSLYIFLQQKCMFLGWSLFSLCGIVEGLEFLLKIERLREGSIMFFE